MVVKRPREKLHLKRIALTTATWERLVKSTVNIRFSFRREVAIRREMKSESSHAFVHKLKLGGSDIRTFHPWSLAVSTISSGFLLYTSLFKRPCAYLPKMLNKKRHITCKNTNNKKCNRSFSFFWQIWEILKVNRKFYGNFYKKIYLSLWYLTIFH